MSGIDTSGLIAVSIDCQARIIDEVQYKYCHKIIALFKNSVISSNTLQQAS